MFELTCPWNSNIDRSHNLKSEKYAPPVSDLSRTHLVSFFSVEISARGQVTKSNQTRLKSFIHKCCVTNNRMFKNVINISSKAALLSSFSLFSARREPTWEDPAPLIVCWSFVLIIQQLIPPSILTFLFYVAFVFMMSKPMICIRRYLPYAHEFNLVICWVLCHRLLFIFFLKYKPYYCITGPFPRSSL